MLKKLSLVAIAVVGTSLAASRPAAAFSCPDGSLPVNNVCPDTPAIPTPSALLAVIGMGMASIRKKSQSNDVDAE